MKRCINFCFFLAFGVFPLCLKGISFQDTVFIKYDSIFCLNTGDTVKFESSLDTALYDFLWIKLNNESVTLSTSNSLPVYQNDSIIRKSFPRDTINKYYVDTIIIKAHFYPGINLVRPPIDCYNELPVKIVSNTKLDTSYNKEIISFSDQMNQPLPSINFTKDANNYFVQMGNGDTVIVKFTYTTSGCRDSNIVFFTIGTKFLPQIQIESDTVCFGDSTRIKNLSIFEPGLSSVNISIEGIPANFTEKGDFTCFIDTNGDTREMYVTIDQLGCVQMDTFTVSNLQKPNAKYNAVKTCENELLMINNISEFTTSDVVIQFNIFNKDYFSTTNSITVPDTLPHGVYSGLFTIVNSNGCSDTISKAVVIDSVTYVWFTGLEKDYCVNQDTSLLIGSQNGGQFSGIFINEITSGIAVFKPTIVGSNLMIEYSFSNGLGCKDSYSQTVNNVYPKPVLQLSGLNMAYCEKDIPVILSINQSIDNQSVFSIYRNSLLIDESIGLGYLFDPLLPGTYTVVNFYTDNNGCFSEIQNTTVVNPLPRISLDSFKVLTPGDIILVGNSFQDEPDVSYLWSNGDIRSYTNLDQPGLYILYAVNNLTSCDETDTVQIEYNESIKEELFNIRIYPNPTTDQIKISLSKPKTGIQLLGFNGDLITINGISTFSTDIFGDFILNLASIEAGYYVLKIPEVGDFIVVKI